MNRLPPILLLSLMLCLASIPWSSTGRADQQPAKPADSSSTKAPDSIVYVPHDFGAPEVTEAGGVRGASLAAIKLMAPPDLSRTLSPTPTFYWYTNQAIDAARFTLTNDAAIEPLLEVALEPVQQAGIYSLDLTTHDVVLEQPGLYRWSVAADLDSQSSSAEAVAQTLFVYDGGAPAAGERSAAAEAGYLAENGYWYDLLDLVSRQIETAGAEGQSWRARRADLLEQAGLAVQSE